MGTFDQLPTEKFRLKMRPAGLRIYAAIAPGTRVQDLRGEAGKVHVADKELGVDTWMILPGGMKLSLQEKYRSHEYYVEPRYRVRADCPDFTMEHQNGYRTKHESEGEMYHLSTDLYFYGWANEQDTDFADWIIVHTMRFKAIVHHFTRIENLGRFKRNQLHGAASFFCIPILYLRPAIIIDKTSFDQGKRDLMAALSTAMPILDLFVLEPWCSECLHCGELYAETSRHPCPVTSSNRTL